MSDSPYRTANDALEPCKMRAASSSLATRLRVSGILLAMPLLPLGSWIVADEPFVGPPDINEIVCVSIACIMTVVWVAWSFCVAWGSLTRRLHTAWLLAIPIGCMATFLSAFIIYAYGGDQRWFG
ncbi:MAG: hypothetical protein AAF664_20365 [Planctomycetota bacterium]